MPETTTYKNVTIILHRDRIADFVETQTFKRVDSTMADKPVREQGALSADVEVNTDEYLIAEYCDRRDARLREKLKFCLVDTDEDKDTFDDTTDLHDEVYEYVLRVPSDFSSHSLKSLGKKMDEYIKRGAIFDWYLGAGLDASDTEGTLEELCDSATSIARGNPWGYRPMQPFGPAFYDYNKRNY